MSIADLRRNYMLAGLSEPDLAPDPIRQFDKWFGQALAADIPEPNAMTLATVSPDGAPAARTVLLKGFDASGFVFYTNYESHKGKELDANPRASLLFCWLALERQVRIDGTVEKTSREESAEYFHSRPVGSQHGAWASSQSQIVPSREALDERLLAVAKQYEGQPVPLPPHWGGYRVTPTMIEFWQGRENRMHDRLRYRRADANWKIERLSP